MRFFIKTHSPVQLFALSALVRSRHGWVVAGDARDLEDACRKVRVLNPEIILLDLGREEPWEEQVRDLRTAAPGASLVVLGVDPDLEAKVQGGGADLFFNKANSPANLLCLLDRLRRAGSEPDPAGQ